ncbi:MAG TPA: anthranilate synthase component I [Solirubrobacterales bacterium]|nr:anthranilate synthase component I [Solirubrobacterales bacterium]
MTTLERARELSASGNVVPVVETFVDDTETPVSAFLKLRDEGPCFLLESAEQGGRLGRYSFLGFSPHLSLRWDRDELLEWEGGAPTAGEPTRRMPAPDPYAAVAQELGRFRLADAEGVPFAGGAVGLFGYDLVRTVEPLGDPNQDPLGLPDLALMVCELIVAFDHHKHEVSIIALAFTGDDGVEPAYERAVGLIAAARERLRGAIPAGRGQGNASGPGDRGGEVEWESNLTREQFEDNVARIVEYVHAGDAFQVVPSQRFTAACSVSAFSIYRGLRAVNPSPYMYVLDFGDFEIAGASPEPLVKVTGRRVETRPIAGTYPRGSDEEEDRANAERLLADPKERAEHVMLVDLGRNDLGRVCEYGSVSVDELMAVETYSHVLHIVSRVSGRLREGLGAMDVLRAALPAGTLSGAPKVRAMQIIDELEPHKRCSYGGAIGYLDFRGDLDVAIHIRTVVVKDGKAHVQAGGGTVADAKPDYEYRESLQKAKAIFGAVELARAHPEWE